MVKKTTFQNGLRLLTIPMANSKVATVLVLVGIGSKYEKKSISGISHFLEHMYFKGTKRRTTPRSVVETLDRIGGSYNAFTGDEYTGYYAKVAKNDFKTALDWVSDIFLHSTIPSKEVRKEKEVIIAEIKMTKDHPINHIQRLWMKLLYGDQPAGRDIAGTKKTVSGITRKNLVDYMRQSYTPLNTVVCVAGSVNDGAVKSGVGKYFGQVEKKRPPAKEPVVERQKEPSFLMEKRSIDQTHICLGVRSYDIFHPDRYVLDVMETILGRMMSSRLFMKIREELGLAYYIKTEVDATSDSGFLVTQAGVDSGKAVKAVAAIIGEYKRIASRKVSGKELKKAKDNIRGRTAISLESSDARAYFYGMQEILESEFLTPEEIFKKIDKVTSDDILRVSKNIFRPEALNLAVLGPFDRERDFKKTLLL